MKKPVVITLLALALVLICVGIGSVVYFANGFQTNNPFDRNNISSVLEESQTLKIDAEKPLTLKVADDAGNVTVLGGDVDVVEVKVVKTAYDSTQSRADEEVTGIKYTVEQNGNAITLKYEIPDSMNFNNNVNTVDFIVTVPTETTVDIKTGFGEISVSDTKGQAAVATDFGDVTVEKLDGALEVDTNSGRVNITSVKAGSGDIDLYSGFGSMYLKQVSGANIKLESNSGTLDLNNVRATKDIDLSTDFGNIEFETGSTGSLTIKTNSGTVTLVSATINGILTLKNDFGDLALEKVKAKSYDLQTNSGAISIDGAQGEVKAHTEFGNITVDNAENVILDLNTNSGSIDFTGSLGEGNHVIHSDFGDIQLSLPADAALNVDFETDFGSIRSDIPVTITLTGDLSEARQAGTMNGGGSEFKVSTNSGNITIKAISK